MTDMVSAFDLLVDDASGRGLKQLREEFFDMRVGLKRSMDAGLSGDDMTVARQALAAVDAAEQASARLYDAWNH